MNHGQGHFGAIKKSDNTLTLGSIICVCGKNVNEHTESCAWTGEGNGINKVYDIEWQPWNATIGKDSYNRVILPQEAGYYYLAEDIQLGGQAIVGNAEVYLDLNGHKATATNGKMRVIYINDAGANYSITDSSDDKTGSIQFDENSYVAGESFGLLVFYKAAGKVNLYGGTLDMSNVDYAHYNMIDVSTGEFNVYGGTVKPTVARANAQSNSVLQGFDVKRLVRGNF